MAILVDDKTRCLIQGITGASGARYARWMTEYGTGPVAGVSPGKGGRAVEGVPVYDTVAEALGHYAVDWSSINVPPAAVRDAALEALAHGIPNLFLYAERVPQQDVLEVLERADAQGTTVIGPNSPGIISPGRFRLGGIGGELEYLHEVFRPGPVGIMSRSGGMTSTLAHLLSKHGIGQTTAVGVGGDALIGSPFRRLLPRFPEDPETRVVVLFGEVGSPYEEDAAEYLIETRYPKPVVAFIAGRFAQPGFRYGHAGAIVERGRGTHAGKVAALKAAGVAIAESLQAIPALVRERLGGAAGR